MEENTNQKRVKNITPIDELEDFVYRYTRDRDSSHNHEHARKVYENSKLIFFSLTLPNKSSIVPTDQLTLTIYTCAWLNDFVNHNYDKNGDLKVILHNFVQYFSFKNKLIAQYILNIIDNISFPKEKEARNNNKYPFEHLNDIERYIRNIVSDAEKLEEIGPNGIIRAIKYAKSLEPNISLKELYIKVEKHCWEKLYLLKDKYIITSPAKYKAQPLHSEMEQIMGKYKDFKKFYNNNIEFIEK